jgi:hypothetical protein
VTVYVFKQERLHGPSFLYHQTGILHISNRTELLRDHDRLLVCIPVVEINNAMIASMHVPRNEDNMAVWL